MKIALVALHVPAADGQHCADPSCADQADHVTGLGRALAAQGHRVAIYARKDSAGLPDATALGSRLRVEYITAGPAAQVAPEQLPSHLGVLGDQLAARWRQAKPDIVHAYHWTSGLAAVLAARDYDVPIVQTFGSLAVAERRSGQHGPADAARGRMEACLARTVTGVLASSSEEVSDLARLGVPGTKVTVVPAGVDTGAFKPEGQSARRSDLQRLIYVGPLADHHRLDILIRALPDLRAELVIAGGPSADDLDADVTYKKLGKLAADLGVADRVIFTGQLTGQALAQQLRSADLFVSAARHEPLGIAAIRAMACGTPVVAPTVGACADAVIDGTSGVLMPPSRPDLLVRRLRDILSTPMKLAAFGIAAADRARSRYAWDRVGAETVAAYERYLERYDVQASPTERPRRAGSGSDQDSEAASPRRRAA
jgi:D-inositol-3-phosphate glycosyltransferase